MSAVPFFKLQTFSRRGLTHVELTDVLSFISAVCKSCSFTMNTVPPELGIAPRHEPYSTPPTEKREEGDQKRRRQHRDATPKVREGLDSAKETSSSMEKRMQDADGHQK